MAFIYKYVFKNGMTYIGAEGATMFKRATDHFAEALKVYNPERYHTYFTYFMSKSGNLFGQEFYNKKIIEGTTVYQDSWNPQEISIYWGQLQHRDRNNTNGMEKKFKTWLGNRQIRTSDAPERENQQKMITRLFRETQKDYNDWFKQKQRGIQEDLSVKSTNEDPVLKEDMETLLEQLQSWSYWRLDGFKNWLSKEKLKIGDKQVSIEGQFVKRNIKVSIPMTYLNFVQYYISNHPNHAIETLVSLLTLKDYNAYGDTEIKELILNNKFGDLKIQDLCKNSKELILIEDLQKNNSNNFIFYKLSNVIKKGVENELKNLDDEKKVQQQKNDWKKDFVLNGNVNIDTIKEDTWTTIMQTLKNNLIWTDATREMFKVTYANLSLLTDYEKIKNWYITNFNK